MTIKVSLDELGPADYLKVEFPAGSAKRRTGNSSGQGDATSGWVVFGLTT